MALPQSGRSVDRCPWTRKRRRRWMLGVVALALASSPMAGEVQSIVQPSRLEHLTQGDLR